MINLILIFVSFLSLFESGLFQDVQCPPEALVEPCSCCDETGGIRITCSGMATNGNLTEEDITGALQRVGQHFQLLAISPILDSLLISYASLTAVHRSTLGGLAFREIWFDNNIYLCLDRIDRDSFVDSKGSLQRFKATIDVIGEATKEHTHDGTILERFNDFHHLQVLDFMNYNLTVVPNHYYCKYSIPNIRQLWLNSNGIRVVEDLAFHHLNLTMLSLLNNQIQRITPYTFAFDQPSEEQLHIHLWMNQMSDEMFEPNAFAYIRRPLHLDISSNRLQTLSEDVFLDLLANNKSRLTVDGNPIGIRQMFDFFFQIYLSRKVCDCRLAWLFQSDYHERVEGLLCHTDSEPNGKAKPLTKLRQLGKCSIVRRQNSWLIYSMAFLSLVSTIAVFRHCFRVYSNRKSDFVKT